jgi:hypothetical protein
MMEEKRNLYKFYLKDFYTEKINRQIFNELSDYTVGDNLIITTPLKPEYIKSIVCSLLLKESKEVKYYSIDILKVIDNSFSSEDKTGDITYYENIDYLILIETSEMDHKLYKSVVSSIVYNRIMKNKKTLLILTNKKSDAFLNKDIIDSFKTKDLKLKKITTDTTLTIENRNF